MDREAVANILLYHVVAGKVMLGELSDGLKVTALNELELTFAISPELLLVNESKIVGTDILASNGVVHPINQVLMPEVSNAPTIVDIATGSDDFSLLMEALVYTDLVEALQADGPFTVFAPHNEAFEALLGQLGVSSIIDLSKEAVTNILLYHVVEKDMDFTTGRRFRYETTLSGEKLFIFRNYHNFVVNNVHVIAADIEADNGQVQVINSVLLPPSFLENSVQFSAMENLFGRGLVLSVESMVDKRFSFTLKDSRGRTVSTKTMNIMGSADVDFDTSDLRQGIYFLKVKYDDNVKVMRLYKR